MARSEPTSRKVLILLRSLRRPIERVTLAYFIATWPTLPPT